MQEPLRGTIFPPPPPPAPCSPPRRSKILHNLDVDDVITRLTGKVAVGQRERRLAKSDLRYLRFSSLRPCPLRCGWVAVGVGGWWWRRRRQEASSPEGAACRRYERALRVSRVPWHKSIANCSCTLSLSGRSRSSARWCATCLGGSRRGW